MLAKIIKKSFLNRFDDFVDLEIYKMWLSRYEAIKQSGRQPFIPEMPEKYFSQNDEDGYSLKIFERFDMGLESFVEIGVGNGLENNTLIFKANGLSGIWIDAEKLPSEIRVETGANKFRFVNEFVTPDNVNDILNSELDILGLNKFDILSLDVDGDDLNILKSIISVHRPKVIIAEVNSKLGPFAHWSYSPKIKNTPSGDYFGMSFQTLKQELASRQYRYLAMNAATGLNAFFIDDEYADIFPELKKNIGFVPPFYRWPKRMFGYPSFALVNSILNG